MDPGRTTCTRPTSWLPLNFPARHRAALTQAVPAVHQGRSVSGKQPRCLDDLRVRDPCQLRDFARSVGRHPLLQLPESDGLRLDKVGGVVFRGNHTVQQSQRQRGVATGTALQPKIGLTCLTGALGINDDELRSLAMGGDNLAPQQRHRRARAHAPDDHAARNTRDRSGEKRGAEAVGQRFAEDVRPVTDLILTDGIGAAQEIHEALAESPVRSVHGAEAVCHGLWPVIIDQDPKLLGNLIEGFVPTDLAPLSGTAGTDALEWCVNPIRRVVQLGCERALGADESATDGMLLIPRDLGDATSVHVDQHTALLRTGAADSGLHLRHQFSSHR